MNKLFYSGRLFQCHSANSPLLRSFTATENKNIPTYNYWERYTSHKKKFILAQNIYVWGFNKDNYILLKCLQNQITHWGRGIAESCLTPFVKITK